MTLEMLWDMTIASLLITGGVRLCPLTLLRHIPKKRVEESSQRRFEGTVTDFSRRNCYKQPSGQYISQSQVVVTKVYFYIT
jgi:hypothetical protein